MSLEISPEPDGQERRAIAAALADEEAGAPEESPWARAARPARAEDEPSDQEGRN